MPSAFVSLSSGLAGRARLLAGAALLASTLPLLAVRISSACADALGDKVAAWLIAVVPTPPAPAWVDEPDQPEPPFDSAEGVRAVAFDAKHPRQPARARAAPLSGVRISSAQVLALAARRAMPNAVFVKATAQRPAGLLLSGVSALGVGMQDGDVLTEAAGQKAVSVAAVVGVVLAARARHDSEISGRFYRGGAAFLLTVEQPYLKGPVPG